MTLETWLLFALTETVLCLTPGAAVLTVLSSTLTGGARSGVSTSVGVLAANAVYFGLSATGIFAILVRYYEVFFFVRWLGAAYLVWLGVQTWRRAGARPPRDDVTPRDPRRGFVRGFAVQIANPKSLLFFGALLPQFVDPTAPVALQLVVLGVTSIVIEAGVLSGYAGLGARASGWARTPRFARRLDRLAGGLLVGAGAGLAALRRS